jgi:hypothetical protein
VTVHEDPLEQAIGRDAVKVKPWRQRMIYYQRVAGGFMMIKGLIGWAIICGLPLGTPFEAMRLHAKAWTIFFSVIDIVAGVALWLSSAWGGTLWLVVVAMQISADLVFTDLAGVLVVLTIIELVLVAGYVLVRFKVYEEDNR